MTLEQYRIKHSLLIEKYQWIEFDLEGLYAFLSDDPFHIAIQEIEKDSIGGVVREIQGIEKQQNITVFSPAEYEALDRIRERRNFWCHVCYTESYDRNMGTPRNAEQLSADLREAETVLEWVRQIKDIYIWIKNGIKTDTFPVACCTADGY